jgi:amino acid adenylation domain-containing protein
VALDRSAESIAVLLAILQTGAAYLPVDASYPAQRLAFMLQDATACLVVTNAVHQHVFASLARTLVVEALTTSLSPSRTSPMTAPVEATATAKTTGESLAYVMYTSGSTGTPKGIEICHQSILRLVLGAVYVDLSPQAVVMHAAPLGFDASTLEIWGPLLNGGCCVLHDEVLPTPTGLANTIGKYGVNTAWLTSALFNTVVDDNPHHLRGLRQLLIGGEALSVPHVRRALQALPDTTLINGYGPTECTTFTATYRIPHDLSASTRSVPIGQPITDTQVYVLGPQLQPMPTGLVGELYVGGRGLARGYLRQPELTAERFIANPFVELAAYAANARLYKTGDRVRVLPDGNLEFMGRSDGQIKLRGFRIEVGEIEAALASHPGIQTSAVRVVRSTAGTDRLVAYVVAKEGKEVARKITSTPNQVPTAELRQHLLQRLPEFMTPTHFVWLAQLPLTANGKLDARALPAFATTRPELVQPYLQHVNAAERLVCDAFAQALGVHPVGRLDNFFELGGTSLLVLRVLALLSKQAGKGQSPSQLSTTTFFKNPTAAALARAMTTQPSGGLDATRMPQQQRQPPNNALADHALANEPIAIIAMAGRFPGAGNVEQFWDNLCAGRDSITFFQDAELDTSLPASLTSDACYVKARGLVADVEMFDAAFFGISPREAELMDPQQRVFLELCWECLERAGHAPDASVHPVGVFAGMYNASYFQRHVIHRPDLVEKLGEFTVMLANEKDYIATRVANRLNLTGPAISVHTACSTSLVAIAQAFSSLRAGQCHMALAGGVSITCPPRSGYLYQEGAIHSPDGRTRTFDANAQGTVFSDGASVVLLKRLSDALADGNTVHAVIRGAAVNNDGRHKASFTAPSVDGQAAVIAAAHQNAGVEAGSVSYVETHGTATPMGDPVEIEGLTLAFRASLAESESRSAAKHAFHPADVGFCRIGSLKSNVGHMVIAAGAAGVIKTALALQEQKLPASLHFEHPNPKIAFANSPFVVNHQLSPWPRAAPGGAARRAGVSSFGVGGTNAHVVLEEAPLAALQHSSKAIGPQRLQLSARTPAALSCMAQQLAEHLESNPSINLADVAHTLQHGRSQFAHRLCVVASAPEQAASALRQPDHPQRANHTARAAALSWVWMFPGQGAQYRGMGRGLYAQDPNFMQAFEEALSALQPALPFDLRGRMFGGRQNDLQSSSAIQNANPNDANTDYTQPATFCLEYALGSMWLASGTQPAALIGHSVGEFAAAVLAGVMSLGDAARLVALRGRLMQAMPSGSMLAVRMPLQALLPLLPAGLSLAAENAPSACVVAGPTPLITAWQAELQAKPHANTQGISTHLLATSHAFHSVMMDAVVAPFEAEVRKISLSAPRIRMVSTLTGTWLTDEEATHPNYWARHLREPVMFSKAVRTAMADLPDAAFLELGPRSTLTTLVRQHNTRLAVQASAEATFEAGANSTAAYSFGHSFANSAVHSTANQAPIAVSSLRDTPDAEATQLLLAQGQLWALGAEQSTPAARPTQQRRRLRLPTYPFERVRHWVEAPAAGFAPQPAASLASANPTSTNSTTISSRFHMPEATALPAAATAISRRPQLIARLRALFEDVAGEDLSAADADAPFLELGLDSLTLTQAALQVKKEFSVSVTFRQLMESLRSFNTLAEYLDSALPPEPVVSASAVSMVSAPSAAPAAVTNTTPTNAFALTPIAPGAEPSLMHQVIAQQMQLMAQQLALLAGSSGAATAVAQAPNTAAQHLAPDVTTTSAATPVAADTESAPKTTTYDVKKAFGAIARIHTQSHNSPLTSRQRMRLDAFIRRYTERSAKSKAHTVAHRPHLADPRVVNGFRPITKEITYQLVIERSQGSRVWDLDGNEYVDVLNGFGMNLFGWAPEFVQTAVRRQLDTGYEIGPQHPLAGAVAQLVCQLTGSERAGLCNTGSEAVMAAIRIARTVTGRNTVVLFTGSYHGTFDEVLVRAGRGGKGISAAPGVMSGVFGDVRVLDYGTPEALEFIRTNADDLAAVLVEPVQSRRPEFQPAEFLQAVRQITTQSSTCLIFDEVITGFRAHLGGMQAVFNVRADLACYGKVIGGGFPIGVVAGKREYMDALDGGAWQYGDDSMPTVGVTYFAGTFVRHPLALAAAHASLTHLQQQGEALQTQLNAKTTALANELSAFCRDAGAPLEIRHFSSLWRMNWLEDHPLQDLLFPMMRSHGVHILDNFPCFMTTAHTDADLQRVTQALKESVRELQEADFLPQRAGVKSVQFNATEPPVPGARLGKDVDGSPAWFVTDPQRPGKYLRVDGS